MNPACFGESCTKVNENTWPVKSPDFEKAVLNCQFIGCFNMLQADLFFFLIYLAARLKITCDINLYTEGSQFLARHHRNPISYRSVLHFIHPVIYEAMNTEYICALQVPEEVSIQSFRAHIMPTSNTGCVRDPVLLCGCVDTFQPGYKLPT